MKHVAANEVTIRPIYRGGKVLVVAGSDPVAGAGLQADLKAITALGGYAMTAVTAITVQDTVAVSRVVALPAELVEAQILAVLNDPGADGIKLGMLAERGIVAMVIRVLASHPRLPVVADPVLAGGGEEGGGAALLTQEALELYRDDLLPLVTLLTPNLAEAAKLTGLSVHSEADMARAAQQLQQMGAKAVLIKGGHLEGDEVVDLLATVTGLTRFVATRIPGPVCHGTGCTLASAVAARLVQGCDLVQAVADGIALVRQGIRHSLNPGRGQRLLSPCCRSSG